MRYAALLILALAACAPREPNLLNIKSNTRGPDEFAILPSKPLTIPTGTAALPPPTRGGSNRADPTPDADAIIALGGNPNAGVRDGGLLGYATRLGVSPTVRQDLAREDLEFRRDNDGRLLERVFNVNVYAKAYREQALDPYRELARLRRAGVRTPSAPPEPN